MGQGSPFDFIQEMDLDDFKGPKAERWNRFGGWTSVGERICRFVGEFMVVGFLLAFSVATFYGAWTQSWTVSFFSSYLLFAWAIVWFVRKVYVKEADDEGK